MSPDSFRLTMKDACNQFRDSLADMADGTADAATVAHVNSCQSCLSIVNDLKLIVARAHQEWFIAPSEWISAAKALMPETRKIFTCHRLQLRGIAPARGPVDEFQIVVGTDELSLRLMATPTDTGWNIMGQFPSSDWEMEGQPNVTISGPRFQFSAKDLSETAFELVSMDTILQVPPMNRLIRDDSI